MTHAEQRERRKQIAAAVAAGERPADVAARFGTCRETVYVAMRTERVIRPQNQKLASRNSRISESYRNGSVSLRDLAAREGVSPERIRQILATNGVTGVDRKYRRCDCGEQYEFTVGKSERKQCPKCLKARITCACGRKKWQDRNQCHRCYVTKLRLNSDSELAARLYRHGYSSVSIVRYLGKPRSHCAWVWLAVKHRGFQNRTCVEARSANRAAHARMPIAQAAKQIKQQIAKELEELNRTVPSGA